MRGEDHEYITERYKGISKLHYNTSNNYRFLRLCLFSSFSLYGRRRSRNAMFEWRNVFRLENWSELVIVFLGLLAKDASIKELIWISCTQNLEINNLPWR